MQICIDGSMQFFIDPPRAWEIDATLHRSIDAHFIDANLHPSPQPLGDRCKFASIRSGLVGSMQICMDGSMHIFIDPPRAWGIDANLHRSPQGWWDRCKCALIRLGRGDRRKFSSNPPGLGGSMQICMHPPIPGEIDANFHRSPQGLTDRCKFASIPPALGRSFATMQICIDFLRTCGIDANLHRWTDANFHRSPQGWGDRCKFASIPLGRRDRCNISSAPQGLGGWMQICIDPPSPGEIDAYLH